ncbi:peptide deformylase [soil metagenome]
MLTIVQAPSDVLSQPAKEIKKIDQSILSLIEEMKDTLTNAKDPEGVGLAAPQVGKSLQLFIIKQSLTAPVQVFINPVLSIPDFPTLTPKKKKKGPVKLEGCLSLFNIWGVVNRHPTIALTYLDENGKSHRQKYTGFFATIIQHEYDHLQGVLFPKRVLEQNEKLFKSQKDEHGEMVFDEISL